MSGLSGYTYTTLKQDILDYCQTLVDQKASILLEEKVDGEEFTLQTFVDGKNKSHTFF